MDGKDKHEEELQALRNIQYLIDSDCAGKEKRFAEKTNMPTSSLNQLLNGSLHLKLSHLSMIANAYGLKPSDLLRYDFSQPDFIKNEKHNMDIVRAIQSIGDDKLIGHIYDIISYATKMKPFRHRLVSWLLDDQIENESDFIGVEGNNRGRATANG